LDLNDATVDNRDIAPDDTDMSTLLSQRQREILALLKAGKVNKEIARELDISVGTVKQHLVALFRKLDVTNRAMAVSKSFRLEKYQAESDREKEEFIRSKSTVESILEKRPAAVLSLKLVNYDKSASEKRIKDFYKIFAEVAFDFGAVFFSHVQGHCEMIFGVGRVRRHDVLRAVRAAVAVVEDFKRTYGSGIPIQGGLAFGTLVASTDRDGAWSGEAIAGAVISRAHLLALNAEGGMIGVDQAARMMIRFLGVDMVDGKVQFIPLDRNFVWKRTPVLPPVKMFGRANELTSLRSALTALTGGIGGTIIVEGENGMGRSALLQVFAQDCQVINVEVELWVCSLPDSQPGTASLGMLEKPGTGRTVSISDFSDYLRDLRGRGPRVILLDDIHFLPDLAAIDLTDVLSEVSEFPFLFVASGRRQMKTMKNIRNDVTRLQISHLSEKESAMMVASILGDEHRQASQIVTLAAGVPEFIVELCRPILMPAYRDGDTASIPLSIFSVVIERVEFIGIDRRFLHLIARQEEPVQVATVQKIWPSWAQEFSSVLEQAVRVGLLVLHKGDKPMDRSVTFRHPIVRAVMASAAAGNDELLQ